MPRVTQAHCISLDGSDDERAGLCSSCLAGRDMLVLGGIAEPDMSGLEIGLHNYEPIRAMYRRCVEFMPALKPAEIDAAEPVRVGLRPVRLQNVRLERELRPTHRPQLRPRRLGRHVLMGLRARSSRPRRGPRKKVSGTKSALTPFERHRGGSFPHAPGDFECGETELTITISPVRLSASGRPRA